MHSWEAFKAITDGFPRSTRKLELLPQDNINIYALKIYEPFDGKISFAKLGQ